MKKIILILALMLPVFASAQEPEYIGEVDLSYGGKTVKLDKEYLSLSTSVDASLVLFGMGDTHTKIIVPGRNARTRVNEGDAFHLIARSVNNNSDPMSVVRIFQFAVHSSRKAEISTSDVFGGITRGSLKNVQFTASKYGSSSYDISFSSLPVGEYGVIVYNPETRDGKATLVYCFGVGHPKAHSGWATFGRDDAYR